MAVGAEVADFMSKALQQTLYLLLIIEAGVIGSEGDDHKCFLIPLTAVELKGLVPFADPSEVKVDGCHEWFLVHIPLLTSSLGV